MENRSVSHCMRMIAALLIAIIAASLVGCGKDKSNPKLEFTVPLVQETSSIQGGIENKSVTKESNNESPLPSVGESFIQFMEVKANANDKMSQLSNEVGEGEDTTAMLAILPLITSDLAVLPLSMLVALPPAGNNIWEGDIAAMFDGTGRIEQQGDISTFNMEVESKEEPKVKQTITGEYDSKKDSLKATFTTGGRETAIFEYAASGQGYVSQLYLEENSQTSVYKSSFDHQNLYAGLFVDSGKPSSIFQEEIKFGESFVKNDGVMVVIEENQAFVIVDGEKIRANK